MSIIYLEGDATYPQGGGNKIIAHVCNDIGLWGAGFVLAVSKRWSAPERRFRQHETHALGTVEIVNGEHDIWVANMVAQRGVRSRINEAPLSYIFLEVALTDVRFRSKELSASVHMPRIGCGLAGGKWAEVARIVQRTLCDNGVTVYVYDLE
jgi:O-acetyl-ADP-ribose deacetylase (regulator of RNase III)